MRRTVPAPLVTAILLLAVTDIGAAMSKSRTVIVRGRVTDTAGAPVGDLPVRVLATRRVVKFLTIESQPAQTELASGRTDSNGFYEISVPKMREYDFYFLRFYDTTGFDAVKYAIPDDSDITPRITRRQPVVQDRVLDHAPGWPAVQRLMDLYGAGTTRGRIVRQLGVPERTDRNAASDGVERETWWYDSVGVAYVIEDGQVLEKKEFEPRGESPSLARQ